MPLGYSRSTEGKKSEEERRSEEKRVGLLLAWSRVEGPGQTRQENGQLPARVIKMGFMYARYHHPAARDRRKKSARNRQRRRSKRREVGTVITIRHGFVSGLRGHTVAHKEGNKPVSLGCLWLFNTRVYFFLFSFLCVS